MSSRRRCDLRWGERSPHFIEHQQTFRLFLQEYNDQGIAFEHMEYADHIDDIQYDPRGHIDYIPLGHYQMDNGTFSYA